MTSGSPAAVAAAACLALAALAHLRSARTGAWLGAAGAAILCGALAARGLQGGYWPLSSTYEYALAFALSTVLAALLLGAGCGDQDVRPVRALSIGGAALLLAYARLGLAPLQREIRPLPPEADVLWLPLHVGTAALAYGALTVAGAAGGVCLARRVDGPASGRLVLRALAAGYPLLTLSMTLGMVWAQAAWGRYWGWDLKEGWTFVTWLIYTLYWHLHRRRGWAGRRASWLALAGLGALLFTYLGVGWLARQVDPRSLDLF